MNIRTLLATGALLVAAATPATLHAQRRSYSHGYGQNSLGRGRYAPSYNVGPRYNRLRSGGNYRSGGVNFRFGPGGGYYGSYPSYYNYGYYGPSYYAYPTPTPYYYRGW